MHTHAAQQWRELRNAQHINEYTVMWAAHYHVIQHARLLSIDLDGNPSTHFMLAGLHIYFIMRGTLLRRYCSMRLLNSVGRS